MAATQENTKGSKVALGIIGGIGAAIGIWAMTALTFSLSQSGWSVAELARQYMVKYVNNTKTAVTVNR
jgi:hypothetical protein